MNLTEIEAQLDTFTPAQLRQLAFMSWAAFVKRAGESATLEACSEDDPELLRAIDEAVAAADLTPEQGPFLPSSSRPDRATHRATTEYTEFHGRFVAAEVRRMSVWR